MHSYPGAVAIRKKKVSIEKNNLAFYNFVCVVKAIL